MKFKVGDRVEHDFYGMGTVIGVSVNDTPLVEFDNHFSGLHDGGYGEVNGIRGKDGHCWFTDMIKPLGTQTIVIYPKGLETIALLKEGKKVIKQASAKCNPSDTYDFNIGAKLAFSRLMGEDLTVKEIEVAHSGSIDWEAFKRGKFAVHCDTEEKAREFLKECDEQGIKWSDRSSVLADSKWSNYEKETLYGFNGKSGLFYGTAWGFNYKPIVDYQPTKPTVKEVKRPAKVGEWIKVVNAHNSFGYYSDGDIFKVLENGDNWSPGAAIVESTDAFPYIGANEYVVLENYQSEATKALSGYTDKELIDEIARRLEDKQ